MATTTRVRAAHRPVDEQTREKIREAAKSGKSRNAVAREFSVAGETVTRICAEAGITFDRTQTEAAVRAHSIDLAEERALLVKAMLAEVMEQLDLINAPYMVYQFGGMDGNIHSHLLDSAPMDARNIVLRSAGIAFDKVTKVLERTTDGLSGAYSVLDALADGFAKAASEYETAHPEGAEPQ